MQAVGASGLNRPVTCSSTPLPSLYVAAFIRLNDPVSVGTENACGDGLALEKRCLDLWCAEDWACPRPGSVRVPAMLGFCRRSAEVLFIEFWIASPSDWICAGAAEGTAVRSSRLSGVATFSMYAPDRGLSKIAISPRGARYHISLRRRNDLTQ